MNLVHQACWVKRLLITVNKMKFIFNFLKSSNFDPLGKLSCLI